MQFIDFITFILTMVLITFIFRKKRRNNDDSIANEDQTVKEEKRKRDISPVQSELSELQRLLLGKKHPKKNVSPFISPPISNFESIELHKEVSSDVYKITDEKNKINASSLIHQAKSKKNLILIHEIFDKPKSLR